MSATVQAVLRAFLILETINRSNGATVNEIAKATQLPRGTVYRLVSTLCKDGYCARDLSNGRVWLTGRVKQLSAGYNQTDELVELAEPFVSALAEKVVWPVTLTTPQGLELVSRITTDTASPYTEIVYLAGNPVEILQTAAGIVYLAHCTQKKRKSVINNILRQTVSAQSELKKRATAIESSAPTVKKMGYAYVRGRYKSAAIAVPIIDQTDVVACLTMRFFDSALSRRVLEADFLPQLQKCADDIFRSLTKKRG